MALFAELAFRGSFPLWVVILLGLLTTAGSFYLYFREAIKIDPIGKFVMAAVRSVTLWLVLFLLMKPVLVDEVKGEKERPIALVLDNTLSMTQRDPRLNTADQIRISIARGKIAPDKGLMAPDSLSELPTDRPSRAEIVREVFGNPLLQFETKLKAKAAVQYFLMGQRVRGVADSPESPWLDSFKADEPKTALVDSLFDSLQKDENDLPTAVVLITDGRDNSSNGTFEELSRECARVKVPMHIYGVGGSSTGYLQLKDVPVQDTLFVEDIASVPFRWRASGFQNSEVELSVTLNGKRVGDPKRIRVKDSDDASEVFNFTPQKSDAAITGKQELVASIRLISGDQVFEDKIVKNVRVVDRKVKLLYVENAPRWEFKFLQRAFVRDRRVDASFIILAGDKRAMQAGPPFIPAFPNTRKDLFDYDLIIIGDVEAEFFTPEQRNWLKDFVSEGGGLVMIAGRENAPASYLNTPIADLLPVDFRAEKFPIDSDSRTEEFQPRLSDLGQRSAMMSLSDSPDENLRIWRSLPGWYFHYPITKLKPGAVSLLDHPKEEADKKPMSLMAMHYYGKGLVLFCACEETWRWRYNEADKYFTRFWGQVVYQIGLPHTLGNKSAQLALEQGEAILGKPGQVYARLFTPDFRPLLSDKISARLERLDAKPGEDRYQNVTFEAVPNQPGEFVATVSNDKVGRYALKVESGAEPATLEYRVNLPPEHELAPTSMNEVALKQLAEQSGGKFYREESLHQLADDIQPRNYTFRFRKEILLWTEWWLLLVVCGLFTAEWMLRKFSNLS